MSRDTGQLTLWSEEAPASPSPSPEEERAWMASLASCSSSFELVPRFDPNGSFGRTFRVSSLREMGPSGSYSRSFSKSGIVTSLGECLMLSSSEWPKGASVCSLSAILERGPHLRRYCLSPEACRGILRRAARRGKSLPEPLESALIAAGGASRELDPVGLRANKGVLAARGIADAPGAGGQLHARRSS